MVSTEALQLYKLPCFVCDVVVAASGGRAPSPRVRGEGRGEGAFTKSTCRIESPPHPTAFAVDLSPHAGRGEGEFAAPTRSLKRRASALRQRRHMRTNRSRRCGRPECRAGRSRDIGRPGRPRTMKPEWSTSRRPASGLGLGVVDLVGVRDLANLLRVAGQSDHARVEQRDVALELLGRVLLRIDGDEQRLHRVAGRPELIERARDRLQIDRADVASRT